MFSVVYGVEDILDDRVVGFKFQNHVVLGGRFVNASVLQEYVAEILADVGASRR